MQMAFDAGDFLRSAYVTSKKHRDSSDDSVWLNNMFFPFTNKNGDSKRLLVH